MTTKRDKLRALIMSTAKQYDEVAGGGLCRWLEMYFQQEEKGIEERAKRKTHNERMATDPDYRSGYERREAEAKAAEERERLRIQRARASRAKCKANKDRMAELGGDVLKGYYVRVKIAQRPVGGIWYHELGDLAKRGTFEACLASQILDHTRPNSPAKVRDIVSAPALKRMVINAEKLAGVEGLYTK